MATDQRRETISPGRGADARQRAICGLYAIADSSCLRTATFLDGVDAALRAGARVIQYRDKQADPDGRERLARSLVELCRRYTVPLIVNDDVDLARLVGAAGVHLGRDDPGPREARAILGSEAIVGVSCYNEFERAERAAESGADYIAFGSMYPSRSKPAAVRASTDLLRRAKARLGVAVVAIGGITPDNSAALIEAGADAVAVIEGVFGQADICAAASAYARLFACP